MAEDQYGFDPNLTQIQPDNPFWDGTDAAHPAWWRGEKRGIEAVVDRINVILDGYDRGGGILGYEKLETLRRRLLELLDKTK